MLLGKINTKQDQTKSCLGRNISGNPPFPLKTAQRPDRVADWNGDDVEGSAIDVASFFFPSILHFFPQFQLLISPTSLITSFDGTVVFFFLGDININEN